MAVADDADADDAGAARFTRKFSQSDLAQMLGVTREAVNKRLGAFVHDGLIVRAGSETTVPDLAALAANIATPGPNPESPPVGRPGPKPDADPGNHAWLKDCVLAMSFDASTLRRKNGKLSVADLSGKRIYDICKDRETAYVISTFSEGLCAVRSNDKKWGAIDRTGKLVVPCRYDGSFTFRDGKAEVKPGRKMGHVNRITGPAGG